MTTFETKTKFDQIAEKCRKIGKWYQASMVGESKTYTWINNGTKVTLMISTGEPRRSCVHINSNRALPDNLGETDDSLYNKIESLIKNIINDVDREYLESVNESIHQFIK